MDDAAGQGQARHAGHVPFQAQVGGEWRRARRIVAVVGAILGSDQPAPGVADAAQNPHAPGQRAEERPLDAAIALLAIEAQRGQRRGGAIGHGARPGDLEQAQGVGEAAAIQFGAELELPCLVGRQDLAGVLVIAIHRRARFQALDVIGVQRQRRERLDHQADHRRPGTLIVGRRDGREALQRGAEVVHLDALAPRPQRQQDPLIVQRQRIRQRHAVEPRPRRLRRIPGGRGRGPCRWRVTNVGDADGRIDKSLAGLVLLPRAAQRERMPDGARAERAARAQLRRSRMVVGPGAERKQIGAAIGLDVGHQLPAPRKVIVARAKPGKGGPVAGDVELAADQRRRIVGVIVVVRDRDRAVGRRGHRDQRRVHAGNDGRATAIPDGRAPHVQGRAQALATIVQRERADVVLSRHAGQRRAAIAPAGVDAQPPFAASAEAPPQVRVRLRQRRRLPAHGDTGQRLVGGALGHDIDAAAHRGHAVEQRARPQQDLDALRDVQRRRTAIGRHQAIQAIDGRLRIRQRETTDLELLADIVGGHRAPHRRHVVQHVAQRGGLLILDQRRGIAGLAEGRVAEVDIAQQPEAAARGNLPARMDGREFSDAAAFDHHGFELAGLHRAGQSTHEEQQWQDPVSVAGAGNGTRTRQRPACDENTVIHEIDPRKVGGNRTGDRSGRKGVRTTWPGNADYGGP